MRVSKRRLYVASTFMARAFYASVINVWGCFVAAVIIFAVDNISGIRTAWRVLASKPGQYRRYDKYKTLWQFKLFRRREE